MSYVICALLTARPGEEARVLEAMRAMVPVSRAEDGCETYEAHQSTEDPRRFLFYERWRDEGAWRAHSETEDFRRWVTGTIVPALEERQRGVYADVVA